MFLRPPLFVNESSILTEIVDIRGANKEKVRDAIHQSVQLLMDGELVVVPTEAVYVVVASSRDSDAVNQLRQKFPGERLPLLLKSREEAQDYIPQFGVLGRKMAERGWPGPVVLSFSEELATGIHGALPENVQSSIFDEKRLSLRVPSDIVLQEILRLVPCPLVCAGEQAKLSEISDKMLGSQDETFQGVALVLNSGPTRFGQVATHIDLGENQWEIEQNGVVTEVMVRRMSGNYYLFVCTGNTCRSPMAEGMFRKFLAERLQCSEDELTDKGYVIVSAGLGAYPGMPASEESVLAVKKFDIYLDGHASQPVTEELLRKVDCIYTMTRAHRDVILASHPEMASRVELLSRGGKDDSDPIGGGPDEYEMCCQEIEQNIRLIIDNIDTP